MSDAARCAKAGSAWETPACRLTWLTQEAYAGSCGPGCGQFDLGCTQCAEFGLLGYAMVPQDVNPDIPHCVYGMCFGCTKCAP